MFSKLFSLVCECSEPKIKEYAVKIEQNDNQNLNFGMKTGMQMESEIESKSFTDSPLKKNSENKKENKKGQSFKTNLVKIHGFEYENDTKNKIRNKMRYMTSKSENLYFKNFQSRIDDIIKSSLEKISISESDDLSINC